MCTRGELLAHSAKVKLNLARACENQTIFDSAEGIVYVARGYICAFYDAHRMTVEYTYPDLKPARVYYNIAYVKVWMGAERRLQKSIAYADFMMSLILYTGELTKRASVLNVVIDALESEYEDGYDGPRKLIKCAGGFKIRLREKIMAAKCRAGVLDIARATPDLFDTWEEKLGVLREGLPQPIFEEIAECAVFFT